MHFSASVTICVFLNEDNEEKWAQATFPPDYETEGKRFRINPMHEFRQLDCIPELFVAFNFVSKILKKFERFISKGYLSVSLEKPKNLINFFQITLSFDKE